MGGGGQHGGGPVAHGFLTLSLLPAFETKTDWNVIGYRNVVNYGGNKLRFISPVPAGSKVHAHTRIVAVEARPQGTQVTQETSTLGPTENYTYDATGQLTATSAESFAWDSNGNPTGGSYTVGTDNRVSTDGTYNFTYDDEGNLISKRRETGTL